MSTRRRRPNRERSSKPSDDDVEIDALADALDWTLVELRHGATETPRRDPPPRLAQLLAFRRFPPTARRLLRDALADDDLRERVAARAADDDELGRASWLFLNRPDGWEIDYAGEIDARRRDPALTASDTPSDTASDAQSPAPSDPASASETAAEALRAELIELRSRNDELARTLDDAAERIAELEGDAESARRTRRELTEQKRIAARLGAELATARGDATRFGAELEDARLDLAAVRDQLEKARAGTTPPAPSAPEVPTAVVEWFVAGASILEQLGADVAPNLDDKGVGRAPTVTPGTGATSRDADGPSGARVSRRRTRNPPDGQQPGRDRADRTVRPRPNPGPGRVLESAAGLRDSVKDPTLVVLVDGYNVAKLSWPQLGLAQQRHALIDAVGALLPPTGATCVIVFDGDDEVWAPTPSSRHVSVRFTPTGREADDEILDSIGSIPLDRAVLVISSDRRVRDGASRRGAAAVPAERFARALGLER